MSDIITERSGNILRIQLNRPSRKNAMTVAMYNTMADLLNDTAEDDQIRVVLWHGAGDSFSAGNDIQDFLKNPPGAGESPQARLIEALINFDKPIVVAVQGAAIGGGTTMLTHCDFVFAGESAKFQMPFVNLALVPEAASSWLIPARIGYARAFQLFAFGEPVDGKTAAAMGLVTAALPAAEVRPKALAAAKALASKPAGALQATKKLMRDAAAIQAVMAREGEVFGQRLRSPEAAEAFRAFAERRAPDFSKIQG